MTSCEQECAFFKALTPKEQVINRAVHLGSEKPDTMCADCLAIKASDSALKAEGERLLGVQVENLGGSH